MKQQLIRAGAIAGTFVLVVGALYAKEHLFPSESTAARAYKDQLAPIAAHLDAVASGAELLNAGPVNDTLADLAASYNTMPEDQRVAMRSCLAALVHVSDGVGQVSGGQAWTSRSKYEAATESCR